MPFNAMVANPGRLRILTTLARGSREFVQLRSATQLSDGNLATHARRLERAGLIAIQKQFRDGKPLTTFTLNPTGRQALELHARELLAAIGPGADTVATASFSSEPANGGVEDDWVD